MIRLFGLVSCVLLLLCAQAQSREVINEYDVYARVLKTGYVEITETIRVTAENVQIKHGIYRDFPTTYNNGGNDSVTIPFIIKEIKRDGIKEPYHTEGLSNGIRVYIGDKDRFVGPGLHEYILKYQTYNVVGFFPDHDEFYWNITGNGWVFPILKAHAVIEFPGQAKLIRQVGYTGRQGERGRDYILRPNGHYLDAQTTRALGPNEGFTVAAAISKGFIDAPSEWQKMTSIVQSNRALAIFMAMCFITLIFYMVVWYISGRDLPLAPIIPRFELMEGVTPDLIRYVYKQKYDDKVLSAFLVDAAVHGQIKIEERAPNVEITQTGNKNSQSDTQKAVFYELFRDGRLLLLPATRWMMGWNGWDKEKRQALALQMARVKTTHESQFLMNPEEKLDPDAGLIDAVLHVSTQGRFFLARWLDYDPDGEYFSTPPMAEIGRIIVIVLSVLANFYVASHGKEYIHATVIFQIIVFYIFRQPLKKFSYEGQEIYDYAKGLRMYLATAEQARLDKMYPKEMTPEVFETFLPYALALDVEQQWCRQFASYVERAGIVYDSNRWYSGRSRYDISRLGSSLNAAVVTSISSASTAPGSSSGFGSGGGSGGGGGGGGGGGW